MSSESKKFQSLSIRLTAGFVAFLGVFMFLLFLLAYALLEAHLLPAQESLIGQEMKEAIYIFESSGEKGLVAHLAEEDKEFLAMDVCIRLRDRSRAILSNAGSSNCKTIEVEEFPQGQQVGVFSSRTISKGDAFFRTLTVRLDENLVLEGATNIDQQQRELSFFKLILPISGLAVTLIAALLCFIMVNNAMSRVRKITTLASSISTSSIEGRLPPSSGNDEIAELTETFNGMLDRISTLVRSLKQVTDDLAHELRTPIARMRVEAELSLSDVKDGSPEQEMALHTIEECDGLLHLVNTVLDISEIDAQRRPIEQESVDLGALLAMGVELFTLLATERGIALTFHQPTRKIAVVGDMRRLQLVFSNLIDNAIKYTPSGGSVDIQIEERSDTVCVRIIDTGIGIDAKHLPHICDRFYRVNDSREDNAHGLGLTLVRSLLQLHGAELRFESTLSVGTTVIVSFSVRDLTPKLR